VPGGNRDLKRLPDLPGSSPPLLAFLLPLTRRSVGPAVYSFHEPIDSVTVLLPGLSIYLRLSAPMPLPRIACGAPDALPRFFSGLVAGACFNHRRPAREPQLFSPSVPAGARNALPRTEITSAELGALVDGMVSQKGTRGHPARIVGCHRGKKIGSGRRPKGRGTACNRGRSTG